ncbi:MerR family transcriptional regulator [Lacticaseibacillus pantheris]|jgi:hypothetical protein|uniref:HTH merR-type domain-containing protein n=2 Tax=Lacticaseibacillus pantheris TaxID=171523 RepID=A0A0R1U820_9LACO|nr:MerR family transcriptional regulator [Lacticaseibacillus pantheris]KRL85995.1 hypothetical protein FC50_GL001402 [Lacticaseibacillus pantheris DSM 15945 = JCM 12539 = NBRC 106106]
MEHMEKFVSKMRSFDFSMGIGETCRVSGVTPAQIRYWEKKGYIRSIRHGDGQNKRYPYGSVAAIVYIKTKMDEGYTLAHAAAEAQRHFDDMHVLKRMLYQGGLTVEQHDDFALVMLGQLSDEPQFDVVARVDDDAVTLSKRAHQEGTL